MVINRWKHRIKGQYVRTMNAQADDWMAFLGEHRPKGKVCRNIYTNTRILEWKCRGKSWKQQAIYARIAGRAAKRKERMEDGRHDSRQRLYTTWFVILMLRRPKIKFLFYHVAWQWRIYTDKTWQSGWICRHTVAWSVVDEYEYRNLHSMTVVAHTGRCVRIISTDDVSVASQLRTRCRHATRSDRPCRKELCSGLYYGLPTCAYLLFYAIETCHGPCTHVWYGFMYTWYRCTVQWFYWSQCRYPLHRSRKYG